MPVPLRTDFNAAALRTIARRTKDGPQARRLLALAAIYEGATRTEAARIGGVTVQIVRDWVVKFNAHGPEGLVNRKPPGQPSKLTDAHRVALQAIVEQGPIPAIHGVVRWRLIDLLGFKRSSQHLDGGGCDEGWETALGSGTTSRVAAVARPTRRGAAGEPAAVLGGDCGGSVE